MGKIAKFDVMNASNKVTDMYDGDNFYPFSGLDADGEGLDIEFSEAFGDKLRKKIKERREGLDERLSNRMKRVKDRQDRKKTRQDARTTRKNLKQVEKFEELPPVVDNTVDKIVANNPKTKEPIEKTKEGLGNEKDEKIADLVIDTAKDLVNTGSTDIPILPVDTDGNIKTSWWSTKSTGVKVAIIGGSFLLLGTVAYFIIKSKK